MHGAWKIRVSRCIVGLRRLDAPTTFGIMFRMKKKSYPRFTPARTINHKKLGKVCVYEFKTLPPHADDCGTQTDFFKNNAQPNNASQYGIKLFSTVIEAFAAYQRQKAAAKKRLAPPVGKMIQWKVSRWSRWGYQTCVADTDSPKMHRMAAILCNDGAMKKYRMWETETNATGTLQENIEKFCEDGAWNIVYETNDWGKRRPVKALDNDWRIGKDSDGFHRPRFSIDGYSCCCPEGKLAKGLRKIDAAGMQYDDLWDLDGDGCLSFGSNPRLVLGSKWRKSDVAVLGNDLHEGNIGLWKMRPVCIDFGFHCLYVEARGGYQTVVTCRR